MKEQNDNNKVPLPHINLPHFRAVRGGLAVTNAKLCIQWSQTWAACSLYSIRDSLCWVFDSCGIIEKTSPPVIGSRTKFLHHAPIDRWAVFLGLASKTELKPKQNLKRKRNPDKRREIKVTFWVDGLGRYALISLALRKCTSCASPSIKTKWSCTSVDTLIH